MAPDLRGQLVKLAPAAGLLEGLEARPAVSERIEGVPVAVDPQRVVWIRRAAREQGLVDRRRLLAARSVSAADEVDHALDLFGMEAGVRDAQDAAARLPADHHASAIHERHRHDGAHGGLDVS